MFSLLRARLSVLRYAEPAVFYASSGGSTTTRVTVHPARPVSEYASAPHYSLAGTDSNNSPESPPRQAATSIVASALAFTPPAVPPQQKRSSTSRQMGFCGWYTDGRSPARPLATRQTPRFPQNLPTQLGGRAEKSSGRCLPPWLHPEWATSRVSLGSPTKAAHWASSYPQDRVLLCR